MIHLPIRGCPRAAIALPFRMLFLGYPGSDISAVNKLRLTSHVNTQARKLALRGAYQTGRYGSALK